MVASGTGTDTSHVTIKALQECRCSDSTGNSTPSKTNHTAAACPYPAKVHSTNGIQRQFYLLRLTQITHTEAVYERLKLLALCLWW